MVYEGTVKNGVVVFKGGGLPDGTEVRMEAISGTADEALSPTPEQLKAFWDEMMTFAGRAEGLPSDLAEKHDHYRRERQTR